MPERATVRLHLYDTLGRRVRTLVDRELAGRREQRVDVSSLSCGTYFFRLRVGETVRTERMTVLR